jgi:hypothetical protein
MARDMGFPFQWLRILGSPGEEKNAGITGKHNEAITSVSYALAGAGHLSHLNRTLWIFIEV